MRAAQPARSVKSITVVTSSSASLLGGGAGVRPEAVAGPPPPPVLTRFPAADLVRHITTSPFPLRKRRDGAYRRRTTAPARSCKAA